jgi:hypothetical protein
MLFSVVSHHGLTQAKEGSQLIGPRTNMQQLMEMDCTLIAAVVLQQTMSMHESFHADC